MLKVSLCSDKNTSNATEFGFSQSGALNQGTPFHKYLTIILSGSSETFDIILAEKAEKAIE